MADSPPRRNSRSPSPWKKGSRSRSRSKSRSRSRSRSLERPRRGSPSRSRGRSRERVEAVNPGNTLYVTGLSTRVTERELEDHFAKEGKVASCFVVVEPRTRISRGFAFVTMDNVDDANRCVKYLNQSVLEGRYITVEKSRRKRPRTPTPGHYLGLKSTRDEGLRGDRDRDRDRGRYRGGSGSGYDDYRRSPKHDDYRRSPKHDDYRRSPKHDDYRRSPRRSPHRGGRDYSPPRHSPYGGGRSRRYRSRSP